MAFDNHVGFMLRFVIGLIVLGAASMVYLLARVLG